jgi:predicted HAD superfamily Cof-like phosphohydrolase
MPHRILSCLREFYEKFDQPMMDRPKLIDAERRKLRMRLLEEAYHEYRYAERGEDLVKIAESLGAMLYVIGGTSLEYGLPLKELFLEIHRANLTKIGVDGSAITREDGKVMKGPNYTKPDIAKVICDALYPEEDEDVQCSKSVLTK